MPLEFIQIQVTVDALLGGPRERNRNYLLIMQPECRTVLLRMTLRVACAFLRFKLI